MTAGLCSIEVRGIRVVVAGDVDAEALVLDEPVSLLYLNPETGLISSPRHPQFGASFRGRVLVLPYTIGGPASSGRLAECVRTGNAPAAILSRHVELAAFVASIATRLLYNRAVPSFALPDGEYERIRTGDRVAIRGSEYHPERDL